MIAGFKEYSQTKGIDRFTHGDILGKLVFIYRDDEFEKLKAKLKEDIKKGDFVLLKGSHSLCLERLEGVLGL